MHFYSSNDIVFSRGVFHTYVGVKGGGDWIHWVEVGVKGGGDWIHLGRGGGEGWG